MNYPDKLRALADYLESRPALAETFTNWDEPRETIYARDWDHFQELIGELGGFEKDGYGGQLTAKHVENEEEAEKYCHTFAVTVYVSNACEQVPKVDEDGMPVMKKKRITIDTDEVEQEVEWKCPTVWSA